MALTSTLHRVQLELADIDRGIYESLELRVACHPSEDPERLTVRVMARGLAHEDGLDFGRGLSHSEDPALFTPSGRGGGDCAERAAAAQRSRVAARRSRRARRAGGASKASGKTRRRVAPRIVRSPTQPDSSKATSTARGGPTRRQARAAGRRGGTRSRSIATWIDVGAPAAARLHRASKEADRVRVFTHKPIDNLIRLWSKTAIHRADAIEVTQLDPEFVRGVAATLDRKVEWYLTIQENLATVVAGDQTLSGPLTRRALSDLLAG